MAIDLTGGMDDSFDHFLAERPDDDELRASAPVWITDDCGEVGLPRIGIEAVAGEWDNRGYSVQVGFPGGRTLIARGLGEGRSPVGDDGVCRTFAAGGLEFRHVKPFDTLTMSFHGTAPDTNFDALAQPGSTV